MNLRQQHKAITGMSVTDYVNNPDVMWKTFSSWYRRHGGDKLAHWNKSRTYHGGEVGEQKDQQKKLSANRT